jgi:FMN-dependent dehydrogenase
MPATGEPAALPLNLHEYEAAARALLSPMTFDFIAGGAEDEVTLRDNRAAFDRWRLLPRVLRGLVEVSTATTVLGQAIALPVLVAPTGLHRLAHTDGELATARGPRRWHHLHAEHPLLAADRGGRARGWAVVVPALRFLRPWVHPRARRAGGGGWGRGVGRHRRRAGPGAA